MRTLQQNMFFFAAKINFLEAYALIVFPLL